MEKLSHYDAEGSAHMVDVSAKAANRREAEASAFVVLSDAVLAALPQILLRSVDSRSRPTVEARRHGTGSRPPRWSCPRSRSRVAAITSR